MDNTQKIELLAYDNLFDQLDDDFDDIFAALGAEDEQDQVDSAASIAILPPVRPVSSQWPDKSKVYDQKRGCKVLRISDAELTIRLQGLDTGLLRGHFETLYKLFLNSAPDTELSNLPKTIDTIKLHTKAVLPLLPLREQEIVIKDLHKQPTLHKADKANADNDENIYRLKATRKLYQFDPIELFKRQLLSDIEMYSSIAHFVDCPTENQESSAQASSIRTTSREFAHYLPLLATATVTLSGPVQYAAVLARGKDPLYPAQQGTKKVRQKQSSTIPMPSPRIDWRQFISVLGGPIFLSDSVRFKCNLFGCSCRAQNSVMHAGRVLEVGLNKRTIRTDGLYTQTDLLASVRTGSVVIKVQQLVQFGQLTIQVQNQLISASYRVDNNELFAVDVDRYVYFILEHDLILFDRGTIAFYYTFKSRILAEPYLLPAWFDTVNHFYIRYIASKHSVRPCYQVAPITSELEILHFGRQKLLDIFASTHRIVRSMLLISFQDAFGLYYNMQRSLIGYYYQVAGLSAQERQRKTNVILFSLRLHGSRAEEVIEALGLLLSILDAGVEIDLNGTTVVLYAFIYMYIGDMLQQQANTSMLSQQANVGCRNCYTNIKDRSDLDVDIVSNGKFFYKDARIRQIMKTNPDIASLKTRKDFGRQYGIKADPSPIRLIMLATDTISVLPNDLPHSKGKGLGLILYNLFCDEILTPKAVY